MDIENKAYLDSEDACLKTFMENVLEGATGQKKYQTISVHISEKLAEAIKNIVGFSVCDYGNEIDKGQVEHIWKEHGKNGRSDHSMSDIRDFARIGYVVEAVPDTKLKKMRVITAFINRNDTFSEVAVSNNLSRYVLDEPQSNVSIS